MLLANKLIERISDPRNAKEYYQSFIRKKTQKQLLINQILLKTQALLIQNQLLENIQKLHINYPGLGRF